MGVARTYHATVLVLKKTKLSEADLILTLLLGDGSLAQAVAKGARKPTSRNAARLDLFCESEVMLARGRNLDIVSDARLIDAHGSIGSNIAATYAAAPVLDLLAQTALPNLPVANLYPMASSALSHMDGARESQMPSLTAAFIMKLLALLGIRPSLERCTGCAESFDERDARSDLAFFSFSDGGYLCSACAPGADRVQLDATTIQWARVLLASTFDEVCARDVPPEASFSVLHFAKRWLVETQGIKSKALDHLLACGLF